MATPMLDRLQLLLDENDVPTPVHKSAHTDQELRARSPGSTIPASPVHSPNELDLLSGRNYDSSNLQLVLSDCDIDPTISSKDMARDRAKRATIPTKHTTRVHAAAARADISFTFPTSSLPDVCGAYRPGVLVGTPALRSDMFCPLLALSKYPYKFISGKDVSQRVASAFFDDGKFWRRHWDVWYVWPPVQLSQVRPLLLAPIHQVEAFFKDINDEIEDATLRLAWDDIETGLLVKFDYENASLRPRFAGRIFEREQFTNLERNCPGEHFRPPGEEESEEDCTDAVLLEFKLKCELSEGLGKSRRPNNAMRREQRASKQRRWRGDLKQAERFLGLRAPHISESGSKSGSGSGFGWHDAPEQSWQEYREAEEAKERSRHPPPIDVSLPPPYCSDCEPVFICIDVEWYERDRRKITEVGLSTLDTRALRSVAPGENAINWRGSIQSRHLRIQENMHLRNGDYCVDNAGFFRFGTSEIVSLKDAPAKIAKCFRPPFPEPDAGDAAGQGAEPRTIVVVGHDVATDIRFSQALGYDISNLKHLHPSHPTLDTQTLHRALHRQLDGAKLAVVLEEHGIEGWNLHNAGNDAAYTMQALLAMAVRSATERGSAEAKRRLEESRRERIAEAAKLAVQRAFEEGDGWSSSDKAARDAPLH